MVVVDEDIFWQKVVVVVVVHGMGQGDGYGGDGGDGGGGGVAGGDGAVEELACEENQDQVGKVDQKLYAQSKKQELEETNGTVPMR